MLGGLQILDFSYILNIAFPLNRIHEFRVACFEDLIFQIMSMEEFEKVQDEYSKLSKECVDNSLYPVV